jgi:hypothetical protein
MLGLFFVTLVGTVYLLLFAKQPNASVETLIKTNIQDLSDVVVNAHHIPRNVTVSTHQVDVCFSYSNGTDHTPDQYNFPLHTLNSSSMITTRPDGTKQMFCPNSLIWSFPSSLNTRQKSSNKTQKSTIEWPEPLATLFIRFLQNGGPFYSNFDCGCFAEYMLGFPYKTPQTTWHMAPKIPHDLHSLQPGEIFGIHDLHDQGAHGVKHLMVAIGGTSGLFLSKFGVSGALIVTDIESAKTLFGGTHCSHAIRCSCA